MLVSASAMADDTALQQCRVMADAGARLACYDAIPLAARGPARAAPVAAAPTAATPEQRFGLESVKKPTSEEPTAIDSTIVGKFEGWGPNARIKLANGQVWRVVDGSEAVLEPMTNPKVRIEKNFIGTMFLRIEGSNQSAKVRRVE
jgi:hypothetical protein